MKIKIIVSFILLVISFPIYPSTNPNFDADGNDWGNRPSWWQDSWPPKNWGDFRNGWNQWSGQNPNYFPWQGPEDYFNGIKNQGTPRPTPMGVSFKLETQPTPAQQQPKKVQPDRAQESNAQAESSKQQEAAKCNKCFEISLYPVPTAGLDYDRNRYIVYLGTDEVIGDETISQKTGTIVGPFAVLEYGTWQGNIGIKANLTFGNVGGISIGLNLKGSTGYESSRIATTMEEANSFKRLKTIPRTFKAFQELPWGTVIQTKLTGGIAFQAQAVGGFVATAGTEFGADGEWLVKVMKPNAYQAIVEITDVKSKQITVSAGVALPSAALKKSWSSQIFFSFQINLDSPEGIAAYEDFFRGKISSVQQAARRNSKLIAQLKKDQFDEAIYKPLMDSKSKAKAKLKTASVGIPFIGSASRNMGSESFIQEELRYLSQQDITALGPVEKGTMVHSFRGSFNTGKSTSGLASSHRERIKGFNVKLEDIILPHGELSQPDSPQGEFSGPPSGYRRIISQFEYKFHKDNWTKKDWDEEIKFMARRTGFKEELATNIHYPVYSTIRDKPIDFAEFQASLKISEAAIRYLAQKIFITGNLAFADRIKKNAQFNLEKWFSNPENQNYEQCDNLVACKSRISDHINEAIKQATDGLFKAAVLFKRLDKENSDRVKKDLVKALVRFGSGMIKNQFTVGVFLQELLTNRINNPVNDFAYCFLWKGSTFKESEFILYPSGLRTDRNKCYLKEETQVDEVAKKNDRDLFGSEFILD